MSKATAVKHEYERLQLAAARFESQLKKLGEENFAQAVAEQAKRLERMRYLHLRRLARNDNATGD